MARLTEYSDEQKGQVYLQWIKNDKNTYRTAMEVGMPLGTLKTWKRLWDKGLIPAVEGAEIGPDLFLTEIDATRLAALRRIKALIPDATEKQIGALLQVVKELTDKLDRSQGLPTQTTQVIHTASDDTLKVIKEYVESMRASAQQREDEITIEDADIVEHAVKELNP